MKIQTRDEILNNIIRHSKKYPSEWKAAYRRVPSSFSAEYYILHHKVGVYLIKEYNKTAYKTKGVGSQIARKVDDEIQDQINIFSGDFGIVQGDIKKIFQNLEHGLSPEAILHGAFLGKDYGLKMPVRGKISTSDQIVSSLNMNYKLKQRKLSAKLDQMIKEDGVYTSYI